VASWAQDSAFFDQGTHQGFQLWTVPKTGTYRITAEGAEGGRGDHQAAGQGARIRGDFELAQGDQLTIVVGQAGQDSSSENGGGGGGTFVWEGARSGNPLIVAGGGGGGGYDDSNGWDAATGTSGTNSSCGYGQAHGGQGGRGGGYGGAGWSGDGSGGYGGRSTTFVGGPHDAWGGFGGGGGGASSDNGGGGGGGYSGGASGCDDGSGEGGGGGGSFNAGANAAASMNVGTNHGHVEIEFLEAD
jgi:hypothetical protein